MSIQKKSLLNSLNTTKKAIVASSTPASEETPKVNAPIAARTRARVLPRAMARVLPRTRARVLPRKK